MGDTARRLTGLAVATAALASVAVLRAGPPGQRSPPPDFGPAAPVRAAAPAEPPGAAGPSPEPAPRERRHAPPERVLVGDVGLDARVRPVGVTGGGAVVIPEDPAVAGWYRFGPAPGAPRGSAVLVGHVDGDTGALGEFAALYDVRPGHRVEVRRSGAAAAVYRVVARTTVPKDALPSSAFRRTGPPVLTLVTCAPPFVPEAGGYQANLVVTAEPVPA